VARAPSPANSVVRPLSAPGR